MVWPTLGSGTAKEQNSVHISGEITSARSAGGCQRNRSTFSLSHRNSMRQELAATALHEGRKHAPVSVISGRYRTNVRSFKMANFLRVSTGEIFVGSCINVYSTVESTSVYVWHSFRLCLSCCVYWLYIQCGAELSFLVGELLPCSCIVDWTWMQTPQLSCSLDRHRINYCLRIVL